MRVSVVVPLFNKGLHVEEAIASVLAQTFQPSEIIVIDDGSTDDGVERVEAITHPLVRVIRRGTPGPGGYAARNEGITQSRGNWIAFIDADDLWAVDHLQRLVTSIETGPNEVGCVFSRSEELRASGTKPIRHSRRFLIEGKILLGADILDAWLDTQLCPIWTGAVMIKRELLLEAGLFPAGRATRGGDKDLWLRVFLQTGTLFVDRVTAQFRQDAINRVSNHTAHTTTPIIVETIKQLLSPADPVVRSRLLKLANQELALYARYTVGAGSPVNRSFLRQMSWKGGIASVALVICLTALGPFIARMRRAKVLTPTR